MTCISVVLQAQNFIEIVSPGLGQLLLPPHCCFVCLLLETSFLGADRTVEKLLAS